MLKEKGPEAMLPGLSHKLYALAPYQIETRSSGGR